MLEGMYTAAAGMTAQQLRLDSLADDLANVSTTGYKPARIAFRDLVLREAGVGGDGAGVRLGAGSAATVLDRSVRQGALQTTGNPLDVALQGPGGIEVRLPDGRRALTRDGALGLDRQGRLVTHDGNLTGVRVPRGTTPDDVRIERDGAVQVDGRTVGRLQLRDTSPATSLTQGALEASAVDLGDTMTQMVETQRSFQLASKAIETHDQLLQIANGIKR
jgi:flagellar basal-body rod protein FlgG